MRNAVASEASGSRNRDAVVRAGFSLSYFKQPGDNHETNFICYLLQLRLLYIGYRHRCATEATRRCQQQDPIHRRIQEIER